MCDIIMKDCRTCIEVSGRLGIKCFRNGEAQFGHAACKNESMSEDKHEWQKVDKQGQRHRKCM